MKSKSWTGRSFWNNLCYSSQNFCNIDSPSHFSFFSQTGKPYLPGKCGTLQEGKPHSPRTHTLICKMASKKITRDLLSSHRPWSATNRKHRCLIMRLDVPGVWYNRYSHNKQKCICSSSIWYACRRASTRISPTSVMPAWTRSLWDIRHCHKIMLNSNFV